MKIDDVNIKELEKQRYADIKQRGKYIEVDILIDAEDDISNTTDISKTPVISTSFHQCTSRDIAFMYAALISIAKDFEKDYPAECLYAKMALNARDVADSKFDISEED